MIIFLNEDRAYLSWVAHHRAGFVLDGRRKPRIRHLTMHRARCPAIKSAPSRRFQWTTRAKLKACSLDRAELIDWAADQSEQPESCQDCQPFNDALEPSAHNLAPSKLGREILDYVLDAAVIHLEHEHPPYRLTIGDIAACFAKTPGQLRPALSRLIDDGFLVASGKLLPAGLISPQQVVLPTMRALRTLESFQADSDAMLQAELDKLALGAVASE